MISITAGGPYRNKKQQPMHIKMFFLPVRPYPAESRKGPPGRPVSGAAWDCRKTPESQNGVREISVRSSRQQSMFTAHKECATLVLLGNARLVSLNIVAMIVRLISEDLRSRSLGPTVFDLNDKPLKLHEECIATMRHVQWLS